MITFKSLQIIENISNRGNGFGIQFLFFFPIITLRPYHPPLTKLHVHGLKPFVHGCSNWLKHLYVMGFKGFWVLSLSDLCHKAS
jgi:hypothetical protein